MKKNVFHMQGFSDKETLLMKTSVIPKAVSKKDIMSVLSGRNIHGFNDGCRDTGVFRCV